MIRIKKTYLLFSVLFVLTVGLILQVYFYSKDPTYIKGFLTYFSSQNPLTDKSTVRASLSGNNLKLDFKIDEKDKENIRAFSNNLGVSEEYLEGVSIELEEEQVKGLNQVLPLTLNLDTSDKNLKFNSEAIPALKSSLVKTNVKFGTGSAEFEYKANNESQFYLKATDPAVLIDEATGSGKIYLSEKTRELFPSLKKVSRITISVNGRNVSGEIVLK